MAKVITRQLIKELFPQMNIRVENFATNVPPLPGASSNARNQMLRMFGEDLLADHKALQLNTEILKDADLVLVMTEELQRVVNAMTPRNRDYSSKIRVLKPFLGFQGDVADPWPNEAKGERHGDETIKLRYRRCADELRHLIESGLNQIVETCMIAPTQPE